MVPLSLLLAQFKVSSGERLEQEFGRLDLEIKKRKAKTKTNWTSNTVHHPTTPLPRFTSQKKHRKTKWVSLNNLNKVEAGQQNVKGIRFGHHGYQQPQVCLAPFGLFLLENFQNLDFLSVQLLLACANRHCRCIPLNWKLIHGRGRWWRRRFSWGRRWRLLVLSKLGRRLKHLK